MPKRIFSFAFIIMFVLNLIHGQGDDAFSIINPYSDDKPYPYKASLHNHTQFHPEYMHARVPADQRLKDYRDYDTKPQYGIAAITDHNRVTTPENTIPPGNSIGEISPWGVDDFLWIRGNEAGLSNGPAGGLGGHLLIINAIKNQIPVPKWKLHELYKEGENPVLISDESPASIKFSFFGDRLEFVSCTDPAGGIAKVYINDKESGEINFYSPEYECGNMLFHEEMLGDDLHDIRIVYDRKGKSENKYMGHLIMGYFVIRNQDGVIDTIDVLNGSVSLKPIAYAHADYTLGAKSNAQDLLKVLNQDGSFLVLAHPNSRLVTEGPDKGKQLWNSSGYVYSELDMIFGNFEKKVPPMEYVPHALEIGNRAYDFSERTGFKNAEAKWDYLLSQGIKVWGTASDDSHGKTPREGWIVVYTRAENRGELELEDVMQSLFEGNFYASQGPGMQIDLQNNTLAIKTEKPSLIEYITEKGVVKTIKNAESGSYTFTGNEIYVRARVTRTDKQWRKIDGGIGHQRSAWTNPFFVKKNNDK